MQTELEFDCPAESDAQPVTPLNWIIRTYQSRMEWQSKALEIFLSVNGDSNVARNRVAANVRKFFEENELLPEDIQRWKKEANETESVRVIPPKPTDCRTPYIDWLHIADSLLMSGCAAGDAIEKEQQIRDTEFQNADRSYRKRLLVEEVRARLRSEPTLTNERLLEYLKDNFKEIFKSDEMIKGLDKIIFKKRKMEKSGVRTPTPKAPIRPEPIPRYTTLYFQG